MIEYWIIAISILLIIFFLILFVIRIKEWLSHKKEQRKKKFLETTIKRINKGYKPKSYGIGLGNLLGGFIVFLIGLNLINNISKKYNSSLMYNVTNVTGATSTIMGMTTIFFALGIMSAGVALVVGALRGGGLI